MVYSDKLLNLLLLAPIFGAFLILIFPSFLFSKGGKPELMRLSLLISTGVFILNIFL
jgi:hypothetical protein